LPERAWCDRQELSVERVMSRLLGVCLRAGVERDCEGEPQQTATYLGSYASYPVVFAALTGGVKEEVIR